jgi:hypothetical protein
VPPSNLFGGGGIPGATLILTPPTIPQGAVSTAKQSLTVAQMNRSIDILTPFIVKTVRGGFIYCPTGKDNIAQGNALGLGVPPALRPVRAV